MNIMDMHTYKGDGTIICIDNIIGTNSKYMSEAISDIGEDIFITIRGYGNTIKESTDNLQTKIDKYKHYAWTFDELNIL